MQYAVAIAAIVVAATALFGFGHLVLQLTRLSARRWPVTIGIGLGTVIFLGGLGNLSGIARPWAFNAIILLGLGLAAIEVRNKHCASFGWSQLLKGPPLWSYLLLFVIAVAVGGFVMSTQLVPVIFNDHDDFEKYIPQVVRMLATGTLHDNPIGSMGIETLGGQAVQQGFILANFPIDYINGADALFCVVLSMLIVGSIAFARPSLTLAMLGGILGILAVDPLYVNVAGLYSLAALSLTLVFASCDVAEPEADRAHIEAVVGLLYAAQLAVKSTAISFVGLHFLFWTGCTAWCCGDWRLAFRCGLKTALWSVVFLMPWIALLAPDYIAMLSPPPGSPILPQAPHKLPTLVNPFAFDPYFSLAWYSAVAAIILGAGCGAFFLERQLERGDPLRARAAAFAAFCLASAANYVFFIAYVGPYQTVDASVAVRYAAPWLIAGIGAALTLGPALWQESQAHALSGKITWVSLGVGLVVVEMFGASLQQRISDAAWYGVPQAYIRNWQPQRRLASAGATAEILHGKLRDDVRDAQSRIPVGSPILVWMVTPFLLDYGRNPIREIGYPQLIRPWTLIPRTDYVLWQYGGFAVRQPRDYAAQVQGGVSIVAQASVGALKFGDLLQQIARKSEVLYNDNGIVVLHIACPQGLAQC